MSIIALLHGPNLNLLGTREPTIYGSMTLEKIEQQLREQVGTAHEIRSLQSNHEGAILDKLHEAGFTVDGIVLNAGALTHTSVALGDAVAAITAPVVEVHISNVHRREVFRHHSYLSAPCVGSIIGLGLEGYRLALQYLKSGAGIKA